ncbi:MAG: FHA domain-containing protein [Rikenellaceae bacterium]
MILITIGRNSSNKYTFNASMNPRFKYISGDHAEMILLQDGSIYLIDKTSANGTMVNGHRIAPESEVSIKRGDKIVFGDVAELDWNKIPTVPLINPQEWDVYTIGTDYRNRIKVSDSTNTISRFHAMIKINKKTKKVYIIDHSANGTYVKGNKIMSGVETQIKYNESITLANIPFNSYWSRITPAPKPILIPAIISIAAVLIISLVLLTDIPFPGPIGKWDMEEISDTYGDAVVCVYHSYGLYADILIDGKTATVGINVDNSENGNQDYIYKDLEKQVFVSYELLKNYKISSSTATAFFIDNKGTMATNRHVAIPWEYDLEKCKHITVIEGWKVKEIYGKTNYIGITNKGQYISNLSDFKECMILTEKTIDNKVDVGLLRTKSSSLPSYVKNIISIDNLELDNSKIKLGNKVFTVGYPIGINMFNFKDDNVASNAVKVVSTNQEGIVNQECDKYKFGHSADTYGGASGSPIFNEKGKLIGIHNSGLSAAGVSGYGWGILAKHVKSLYEQENY